MSIGAEFFLKMNTAAFTKGLATANNSIKDLKKELRESGGRRFVEVLGIAGIVKGFSAIINHAQETRKALEEMGKPISDNIASVARFGDAIDGLKGTAMEAGVAILGFFTGVGEKLGNTINELRNEFAGANLDISDAAEKSDRAANAQEGSRNKAYAGKAAANTPEHLRAKAKEADDLRRKNDDAKLDADGKLNAKLHERTVLEKQLSDLKKKDAQEQTMLPVAIATKELELTAQDAKITAAKDAATLGVSGKLNDLLQDREKLVRELNDLETKSAQAGKISAGAIADKNIELQKNRGEIISGTDAADAADEKKRKSEKAVAEANKKLHDFELDRFLPATVADLAGTNEFGLGSSRKKSKAIHDAQQVLHLQDMAQGSANRGDFEGAAGLQGQADKLRQGLSGWVKSAEVDKGKDLVTKFDEAVNELKILNKKSVVVTEVSK